MIKIAFVDLDGVVANSGARFAQATTNGKIDWKLALSGEHVHLDTLIDEVPHALNTIEERGYKVLLMHNSPGWHGVFGCVQLCCADQGHSYGQPYSSRSGCACLPIFSRLTNSS